jgi:hypothetical protein
MALGGIKLRVPAAERERALGRLHRTSTAQVLRLVDDRRGEGGGRCPECGAPAVRPLDSGRRLTLAAVLLGLPMLFRRRASRCAACGHRWKERG